ncbi:MAG: ABC transporter ATP-binding protein, partial [Clostridia bacterium]
SILSGISFELEEHKVMTVLGPNGVGKTTLLKCIMDFLHWQQGETFIAGQPLRTYKEKELWQVISYVPQAKRSVFSYRVLDMVVMGLNASQNFFKVPDQSQYDQAEELLNLLGCQKLIDRYCNQLSGGELQMVMIARALISRPQLLVLDEPESNLDMKNQLRILDAIERASREMNTACLINTHFPNHALNISDQTLMLGLGQKKLFGATKDLLNEENIERFFRTFQNCFFQADGQEHQTIFPYRIASHSRGGGIT